MSKIEVNISPVDMIEELQHLYKIFEREEDQND